MMENKYNIDQIFNQGFQSFEPSFDQSEVWGQLNQKLDKRRKFGFWFLFMAGVLTILLSLSFTSDVWMKTNSAGIVPTQPNSPGQSSVPIAFQEKAETGIDYEVDTVVKTGRNIYQNEQAKSKHKISERKYLSNSKPDKQNNEPLPIVFDKKGITESTLSKENDRMHAAVPEPLSYKQLQLDWTREDFKLQAKKRKRNWSQQCKVEEPATFYISPYVAGHYTFQSVNAITDQQPYADKWNEYDEVLPGYAAGVMLGYEHPKGYNIEAGLEWQQVFEKLLFYQLVTETIKVYSDSAYYWEDENGNVEYFGDTVTTERTYERKVQSLKQHRIWNIPVGLGYTFGMDRMQLGIQLGAVFHMDHQFKGRVYSPAGSFDYLDASDKGVIYNPRLGITWFGSMRLYFMPSNHLEWYIAPGFRYNSSSWTKPETGLQLVNQFAELKVGARVFF